MNLPVPATTRPPLWTDAQMAMLRVIHYAEYAYMAEKYAIIRRMEFEEGVFFDDEAQYYNLIMLLTMGGMVEPKLYRVKTPRGRKVRVWAYDLTPKGRLAVRRDARMTRVPSASAG